MREWVLAGVCFGLLLLVTTTHTLDNVPNSNNLEEEGGWLSSASDLLHRVKRQLWFFNKPTVAPSSEATTAKPKFGIFDFFRNEDKTTTTVTTIKTTALIQDEDQDAVRYTRSTVRESVTASMPSDDEDLGQSGSGTEPGGGDTTWESDNRKPRYYRISVVVEEPFKEDYENSGSATFRFFSQSLTHSIGDLYTGVQGDQQFRVIKMEPLENFKMRVFLDLSSIGNHDSEQLQRVLQSNIKEYRRLGNYVVEDNLIFNEFGVCESDEIQCSDKTGCFAQNSRCDGKVDCADKSDESGCESVITASVVPTVASYNEVTIAGHRDHGSAEESQEKLENPEEEYDSEENEVYGRSSLFKKNKTEESKSDEDLFGIGSYSGEGSLPDSTGDGYFHTGDRTSFDHEVDRDRKDGSYHLYDGSSRDRYEDRHDEDRNRHGEGRDVHEEERRRDEERRNE